MKPTGRIKFRSQRGYFKEEVEHLLLGALTDYYGSRLRRSRGVPGPAVALLHPFWQYDANSGIQGQEGKSIIGVEDEHSDLIPPRYQQDPQYEIKSTGFKHRIDFAAPARFQRFPGEMADYKGTTTNPQDRD